MTQVHCTRAQTAVLQVLRQQRQPISAQALYSLMQKQQQIGLATVYRALDALTRCSETYGESAASGNAGWRDAL